MCLEENLDGTWRVLHEDSQNCSEVFLLIGYGREKQTEDTKLKFSQQNDLPNK